MKVQRKISPTTIIEAEGQTVVECFEAIARLEDVFHGHELCGLCGGKDIAYQVRQDKDLNKYYMAVCLACGGEFRFGVRKQPVGSLFPQLNDKEGKPKLDNGWQKKWEAN